MYIKTNWVARVGTALNRFLKTNESAGSVELTNDPTGVTIAGTPFTVANMNKIETGIYNAHVVLDDNVNQDVKTTANPTFAGLNGFSAVIRKYKSINSSFASPGVLPYGLAFDGTNLISCDTGTDLIYIHDRISSTILSSFASPGTFPSGLTFDGTNLISCDRDTHLIYIHDRISSTILSSFASPGSFPSGLTFDGTNLISCDYDTHLIYIHADLLEFVR